MTLLAEAGLIGPTTVIVTTVHPLQVLDEPIPEAGHDFSVDLIITTSDVIRCSPPRRRSSHGLPPARIPIALTTRAEGLTAQAAQLSTCPAGFGTG